MSEPSPIDLLDAAIATMRPVVEKVDNGPLDLATPCSEWDLRQLLAHVAGRAVLSARAAESIAVSEFPETTTDLLGHDPRSRLLDLLDASLAAWRQPGADLAKECQTPLGPVPGFGVVTFHAQDVFVHSWDIARTLNIKTSPDETLTEAMLALHHQTITEDLRAMFFAPIVPVPGSAPALDRLVGFLGRRP